MTRVLSIVRRAVAFAAIPILTCTAQPIAVYAAALPDVGEQEVIGRVPVALLRQMANQAIPNAQGAVGLNLGGWERVEYQRDTTLWAQYGIAAHNAGAVRTALRIADYAFAHQQADGGFSLGPGQSNAAGAASWFVNDFSHAAALLQQNGWFETSAATATLRANLSDDIRRLRAAVRYLVARSDELAADTAAANRILQYAVGYLLGGQETGNQEAVRFSRQFSRSALGHVTPDGVFVEAGGFDSSYQCVSLYMAQVLVLNMQASQPLRERLWSAIESGMARERRALLPSGEISTLNNTRVGRQSISGLHGGVVHQFDRFFSAFAFEYFAGITQRPAAQRDAVSVLSYYWGL